jgi:hypothetical protein
MHVEVSHIGIAAAEAALKSNMTDQLGLNPILC